VAIKVLNRCRPHVGVSSWGRIGDFMTRCITGVYDRIGAKF
jgi:hypothetical protein